MAGETAVLACALALLGRSPASMPPITLIQVPPAQVSANAEAFVWSGEAVIYVITSAPAFRNARCDSPHSLVKLASVLAHEEWHVRHGGDERGAYNAQLRTLLQLGAQADSSVYQRVARAMRSVEAARGRVAVSAPQPAGLDPPIAAIDQELEAPWSVSSGR
jgi:hypothetical protein